jgi:signal transduction histidine kinase
MPNDLNRQRTLWIVDDSATDAERVRRVLSNEYKIEVITDGAAALERLASGAIPDLLLIDWIMPGLSGVEVCQYVRSAEGKLPQVPIILLTAQHGSGEIVQAFRSGANDYISKPFVDEELRARVRTLMGTRKLLERAESAEEELRELLVHAPDPIFAIDRRGRVTFANAEALKVLRRPEESVVGETLVALIPGPVFSAIFENGNRSQAPLADVQIGDRIFSPSIRALSSRSTATTTISLRDVTDRRNAEARRLDFYSVIAHDLRTPITSVLMRLQLAFRGKHGVLPAGLIADLQKIETSLRAQVGMVNDFLELAKLEGAGYKIEREPVVIAKLIETTMEDFQPLLEKNQLQWKHVVSSEKAIAYGDKQRLAQVLANLIGNAIKFTPPSGIITTSVSPVGDYIETVVTDTGRGIPATDIPHLFERFTRVQESANETIGTGLGLMIVREIVDAHDGIIGVSSEPGIGSRFWFRIPRCASTEASLQ